MKKLGYKIYENDQDYFDFREYVKLENHNFKWDMEDGKFPIDVRYGFSNRKKMAENETYYQEFREKLWGWDD